MVGREASCLSLPCRKCESCRWLSHAVRHEYAFCMNPTVVAAAIGVGGTVVVGLAGFGASIWNTRRTIAHDREDRVWDKRASAYETALSEIVNRSATRERWLNSSSENWTAENLDEHFASQYKPEWFAAWARMLAYASQQVLKAFNAARSADFVVSQAFDRVGERIAIGKLEIAAGTLTFEALRDQVFPELERVRGAVEESANRDQELVALIQIELQGGARDRPPAIGCENELVDD
jgi:hypothetical protein